MGMAEWAGGIAMIFSLGSWMMKTDKMLKCMVALGALGWAFHFGCLGKFSGAWISGLIAMRSLSAMAIDAKSKAWKNGFSAIFAVLFTLAMVLTYQNVWSLFPWLATLVVTFAFAFCSGLMLRRVLYLSDGCWLVYGVAIGSPLSIAMSVLALLVNTWGQYRAIGQEKSKTIVDGSR